MNTTKAMELVRKHFNKNKIKIVKKNLWGFGTILLKIDDSHYKLDNFQSLYKQHEDILKHPDGMNIDVNIGPWIEAAEDVHTNEEFIETLMGSLNKSEKNELINVINKTGNLHKIKGTRKHILPFGKTPVDIDANLVKLIHGTNTAYDFWMPIYIYSEDNYDVVNDTSLFGKAIVSAMITYNAHEIIKDYTLFVIEQGDELLTELVGDDNFITLFDENDDSNIDDDGIDNNEFYLYKVDSVGFE